MWRMQWTEGKGRPGTYTGQVNGLLFPSSRGDIKYDAGAAKEGEWKSGRCHKGNSSIKYFNNSGSGNISSCSDRPRSKSREGGRSRSYSCSTGARQRSRSRVRGRSIPSRRLHRVQVRPSNQ